MGFSSTPKDTTFGKIFGLTLSISDLPKASYPQQGYLLRMSRFADLGGLRPPPCQASFRIFTGTQAPQLCQNLSGRSKQSHFFTPTLPTLVDAWPETSLRKRELVFPQSDTFIRPRGQILLPQRSTCFPTEGKRVQECILHSW